MKKIGSKLLIVILIVIIIGAGAFLAKKIIKSEDGTETINGENMNVSEIEDKGIQIFKGNSRPFAVMIDNHKEAWPQVRFNKSIYDI